MWHYWWQSVSVVFGRMTCFGCFPLDAILLNMPISATPSFGPRNICACVWKFADVVCGFYCVLQVWIDFCFNTCVTVLRPLFIVVMISDQDPYGRNKNQVRTMYFGWGSHHQGTSVSESSILCHCADFIMTQARVFHHRQALLLVTVVVRMCPASINGDRERRRSRHEGDHWRRRCRDSGQDAGLGTGRGSSAEASTYCHVYSEHRQPHADCQVWVATTALSVGLSVCLSVSSGGPIANLKGPYFHPCLSVCVCVCVCVSDRHFYPSTLTDFDETWSQGPYCDLVWPRP